VFLKWLCGTCQNDLEINNSIPSLSEHKFIITFCLMSRQLNKGVCFSKKNFFAASILPLRQLLAIKNYGFFRDK